MLDPTSRQVAVLKGSSREGPDDWLGNMTAALILVSGFPLIGCPDAGL